MVVLVSGLVFLVVLIALVVIAERSLRAQKGSMLKRSREEETAAGHAAANTGRFGGGDGGLGG